MPNNTLRAVALERAQANPSQYNSVLDSCPLVDTMIFLPSNSGMHHKYAIQGDAGEAAFVEANAPRPAVEADSRLESMDLGVLGFSIEIGEDSLRDLYPGLGDEEAFAKYLLANENRIIQKSAKSFEAKVYAALYAYAAANGRITNKGGGSNGVIMAVRFTEDNFFGVYDPDCFKQGTFFTMKPVNGGNLHKLSSGKMGYAMQYSCYINALFENENCIGVINGIDASHKPTADDIDEMLLRATVGDPGRTVITTNSWMARYINGIKGDALRLGCADKDYSRAIATWNNTPIVYSYNAGDKGIFG